MGRMLIVKATGRPVEYQSLAGPGTLLKTIADNPQYGWTVDQVEEREITQPTYEALVSAWEVNPANPDAPALQRAKLIQQLAQTDAKIPRITEDVLDALITKGVIALTDLPAAAQQQLAQRKQLRAKLP